MEDTKFTKSDIVQLKSYSTLKAYCEQQLGKDAKTRQGGVYPCPWGDHENNKLQLSEAESGVGLANCFACGRGGSVVDVASGVLGLDPKKDFTKVLHHIADVVGYRPRSSRMKTRSTRATTNKATTTTDKATDKATTDQGTDKPPFSQAQAWACVKKAHEDVDALTAWAQRLNLPLAALARLTDSSSIKTALLGLDERGKLLYMYPSLDAQGVPFFSAVKVRALPNAKMRFSNWKGGRFSTLWGALAIEADTETVIITEGESDALAVMYSLEISLERAHGDFSKIAVVAKPNASTFRKEWAGMLKGKEIILAVDADEAGQIGAKKTIEALHQAGVKQVYTWLAPEGIKDARDAFQHESPYRLVDDIITNKELAKVPALPDNVGIIEDCNADAMPIICLGEEGKNNVYWSLVNKAMYKLSANEHNPNNMLRMATVEHFASWICPSAEKDDIQNPKLEKAILNRASKTLLEMTKGRQFNASHMRGAGVWADSQGLIYNAGESCFLSSHDGGNHSLVPVSNIQGGFIYSKSSSTPSPAEQALSDDAALKVLELFKARTWASPFSGELLVGWLVCSALSGALPFRPHVWVNAPAGTGKTFLRDDILAGFGQFSLALDGAESTEAGLRGALNGGALPVVWDELERDAGDSRKETNINKVIALIRNATKGGKILKGVSGGGGVTRQEIKASFMLFSIDHALEKDSDISRFLCLRLMKARNAEIQGLLQNQVEGRAIVSDKAFFSRFITRILREYPAMLENITALDKHLQIQGHNPRSCEMFACLFAGYHAFACGGNISSADLVMVDSLLKQRNEQAEMQTSDPMRAIECLLNHTESIGGARRFSLRQIIEIERDSKNGNEPTEYIEERATVIFVLNKLGLAWHTFSKTGEQCLLIKTKGGAYKPIFAHGEFESRPLIPLLMEGGKKGDVSSLGIQCKDVRISSPNEQVKQEEGEIKPYQVYEKKAAGLRAPELCLCIPEHLIFP